MFSSRVSRFPRRTVLLCLWLALAVGCGSGTKLPALPAEARILAFGDSLTYGTGADPEQSYPAVLQGLIGHEVINAGVPGEVSAEGLARLPALLDEYQPQLLILCHGGNDFLRGLGKEAAADHIRAMVRLAGERAIAVILIAVPEFGIWPSPPEFYRKIAEEYGLAYEDETLSRIIRDAALKSDAVHPNAQGYRKLAEALAEVLRKAGAV